jgi:hypothetical protein
MRNLCLLCALALCITACGRRTLNADHARDALLRTPLEILQKEDVEVVRIHHAGAAEAVVETRLRTAFRMEKVRGEWMVREVRIGNGQWEKVGDLARALEAVKIEETRRALDRIADAIGRYRETLGRLPDFKDFVSLSDLLSPAFLTPLIRVDSWNRPLEADRRGPDSILIRSAGPDGRYGTSDDILRIFTP